MGTVITMLHTLLHGVLLLLLVTGHGGAPGNNTRGGKIPKGYVESYWESWDAWENYPEDFAAFLKDVPATPIGSCTGVNLVNIAFGDYSGGIGGHDATDDIIREGIKAIHEKGGYVKIALGGALYSMGSYVSSTAEATEFAEKMAVAAADLGLDGMDLDVEDSGTGAEVEIFLIKETRRILGPDFHITYTLPALSAQYDPWMSTIAGTVEELDAVNVMAYDYYWNGYTFDLDLEQLTMLGLPPSKIVYGVMPGHHDAGNEYTSVEDAAAVTKYALEKGLGGVMTWDINRDCSGRQGNPDGGDTLWQTGQGDGVYLDIISATLNGCET